MTLREGKIGRYQDFLIRKNPFKRSAIEMIIIEHRCTTPIRVTT